MLTAWLGRRFFKGTENRIDAGLIARPLCLKPVQHVGIDAKRDRGLWWNRLKTAARDTAGNEGIEPIQDALVTIRTSGG